MTDFTVFHTRLTARACANSSLTETSSTAVCFPFASGMFAVGGHSGTTYIISRKAVVQRLSAQKESQYLNLPWNRGFYRVWRGQRWKIDFDPTRPTFSNHKFFKKFLSKNWNSIVVLPKYYTISRYATSSFLEDQLVREDICSDINSRRKCQDFKFSRTESEQEVSSQRRDQN